jgi:5'-deoxynucleotidase YfbR-like HD superfamily hydrolase
MKPEIRFLSEVPRWSILPVTRQQSVAEHSYWVSVFTLEICDALNVNPEHCLRLALFHDLEEIITGDRPTPHKNNSAQTEKEKNWIEMKVHDRTGHRPPDPLFGTGTAWIVKTADLFECCVFLKEEMVRGNCYPIIDEVFVDRCEALYDHVEKGREFFFEQEIEDVKKWIISFLQQMR